MSTFFKRHVADRLLVFCTTPRELMTSSSAIAGRLRYRVGQLWPKVKDWKWETIFYQYYRSIFNHCDVIGQKSYRIQWKNGK